MFPAYADHVQGQPQFARSQARRSLAIAAALLTLLLTAPGHAAAATASMVAAVAPCPLFPGSGTGSGAPYFGALGSTAVFCGDDGSGSDTGLWRSDGTPAGTSLVEDFTGGTASPGDFAKLGGGLLFAADDGSTGGLSLWRTDGTSGGTALVSDVHPSQPFGYETSSEPPAYGFARLGAELFFRGNGRLWRTDGTTTGTLAVKPEAPLFAPGSLTRAGGALFFTAGKAPTCRCLALWRTDGTEAGTHRLELRRGGQDSRFPRLIGTLGGEVYLTASQTGARGTARGEIWRSDGTQSGTRLVFRSKYPDVLHQFGTFGWSAQLGRKVIFDGNSSAHGDEPWVTSGTRAGTHLIEDTYPGCFGSCTEQNSSYPFGFKLGGFVLFEANGSHGARLWRTDGTRAGTRLVKSGGAALTRVRGAAFFLARHGLWETNGTRAGTNLVVNPNPNGRDRITNLANVAGSLYFNATDGTGTSTWVARP